MILMYAYFSRVSYNSVSFLQKLHTIGLPFDGLRDWGERMRKEGVVWGEGGGGWELHAWSVLPLPTKLCCMLAISQLVCT